MRRVETRRAKGRASGGCPTQGGLTMVELLVAMAIGLFLLAGIIQLLVSSEVSYRAEEGFSRLQENGRFAVQAIAHDARMARSLGCRSLAYEEASGLHNKGTLNVVACDLLGGDCAPTDPLVGSEIALGYDNSQSGEAGWLASLPANASDALLDDEGRYLRGDVLVLWGVTGAGVYMTEPDDGSGITVSATPEDLVRGRLALVTDCQGSDLFLITNRDDANPLLHGDGDADGDGRDDNATAELSWPYNLIDSAMGVSAIYKAMVFPFDYRVYFICNSTAAGTEAALCRWRPSDGVQELVADIVDMRVTFATGASNESQRADELTPVDWEDVTTMHIELLAASAEEVRSDAASPSNADWPGDAADRLGADVNGGAEDRRQYERFAFTVAVRSNTLWYVE